MLAKSPSPQPRSKTGGSKVCRARMLHSSDRSSARANGACTGYSRTKCWRKRSGTLASQIREGLADAADLFIGQVHKCRQAENLRRQFLTDRQRRARIQWLLTGRVKAGPTFDS